MERDVELQVLVIGSDRRGSWWAVVVGSLLHESR
jgi:hypothetical protein